MYQTILQIKLPYTQAVPLIGSTFKILPAIGTRQRKFEFGDPPNQELNRNIRPQGRTYLKTLVSIRPGLNVAFYMHRIKY